MKQKKILVVLLVLLSVYGLVLKSNAEPLITLNYLSPNFQIFNVSDLVDMQRVNTMEDFEFASLPDIYTVTIFGSGGDLDSLVYLIVTQDLDGTILSRVETLPFSFNRWMQESGGTGAFTNHELSDLKRSDWFPVDYGRTVRADTETMLDNIESGNFVSSTLTTTFELYYYSQNPVTLEENSGLWATYSNAKQIYNPSNPEVQDPRNDSVENSTPILFTWNWFGGVLNPSNWTIIIVKGYPGDDPESVIANRNASTTFYEGAPQTSQSHTYSGTGFERELEAGTYYWQVSVVVPTIMSNITKTYTSNPGFFNYVGTEQGGLGGISGLGGGIGGGQGQGGLGAGPIGGPGMEGGEPSGRGGLPPTGGGETGGRPPAGSAGSAGGSPPTGVGATGGQGGQQPSGAASGGEPGQTGSQGGATEPVISDEVRNILNSLSAVLPEEIISMFEEELIGYNIQTINLNGQTMNINELIELMNRPGTSVRSASFAD